MSQLQNKSIWNFLYIGWIGVVCIILLMLNFELVRLAAQGLPGLSTDARARQMVQFFLPIIMIFVEFRVYDFLIDRADRAEDLESDENRRAR